MLCQKELSSVFHCEYNKKEGALLALGTGLWLGLSKAHTHLGNWHGEGSPLCLKAEQFVATLEMYLQLFKHIQKKVVVGEGC